MRCFWYLIPLFLLTFSQGIAQQSEQKPSRNNTAYLEFYGIRHDFSNGFVSLNYERFVGKRRRSGFRAGLYPDFQSTMCFPVNYVFLTGPEKKHHFEWGAGLVFRIEYFQQRWIREVVAAQFPLMYRYEAHSGFFLRTGFNVWVSWPTFPSPSASFGWRF